MSNLKTGLVLLALIPLASCGGSPTSSTPETTKSTAAPSLNSNSGYPTFLLIDKPVTLDLDAQSPRQLTMNLMKGKILAIKISDPDATYTVTTPAGDIVKGGNGKGLESMQGGMTFIVPETAGNYKMLVNGRKKGTIVTLESTGN